MKKVFLLFALCCASGFTLQKAMYELDNISLFDSASLSQGENHE